MIKKELKERGSVAIYAIAMIFGFFVIVGGAFFVTTSVRKLQLRSLNKVKEVYESQTLKKNEIIDERKTLDISGYVGANNIKSNLIVFLDGYNNNGGSHSNKTKSWINLANDANKVMVSGDSWRANSLALNRNEINIANILSLNNYTMELVFSVSDLKNTVIINKTGDIEIGIDANKKLYATLNGNKITSNTVLKMGKKYTVAVTSNGIMYLNGKKEKEQPMQANISNGSLIIGSSTFSGNIFGVRLYNKALQPNEIFQNYKKDEERFDLNAIAKLEKANITNMPTTMYTNNTKQIKVEHNDNIGGSEIDINKCKWVFNKNADEIININDYTNTFTRNPENINIKETTGDGTYYLHILSVDKIGNTTQTVSTPVIVEKVYEEIFDFEPTTGTIKGIKKDCMKGGYINGGFYYLYYSQGGDYFRDRVGWCVLDESKIDYKRELVVPNEINGIKVTKVLNIGVINVSKIVFQDGIKEIDSVFDVKEQEYNNMKSDLYGMGILTYREGTNEIELPEGLVNIKDGAFRGLETLKKVKIPNSVTNIGSHAFERCISLNNITIPNSVTSIGAYAFYRCTNLNNITLAKPINTKLNINDKPWGAPNGSGIVY